MYLRESTILEFIPSLHEPIFSHCLALYKSTWDLTRDRGSKTIAFFIQKACIMSLTKPIYHNHQRWDGLLSPNSSPYGRLKTFIQRLQHGWSSDYTGLQEEELVHAVSRVTPIRKNLHMRRLIHQSKWLPQKHKRIMILTGDELVEQEELAILSILHTSQSNERNKVLQQNRWQLYPKDLAHIMGATSP